MRRRTIGIVLAAVVVGAAGVGLVLAFGRNGEEPPQPTADPQLSAGARELLALIDREGGLTYHASYEITTDEFETAVPITTERWRKDGLLRQDQEVQADERVLRSAQIGLEDETITCIRSDDDPWQCSVADEAQAPSVLSSDPLLGHIAANIETWEVTASSREVLGRDARCFELVTDEGTADLCFTEEGIPLMAVSPQGRMELVELSPDVDEAVFTPPGQVRR